jgi:UDP-GlcNAc3NAcA epimerase
MLKIITIVGARPQIIKAAALSRAIRANYSNEIKEVIVHTGQHYDENMSKVFFDELQIPLPDYNLRIGTASHGRQIAGMITGIEEILAKEKPCCVVLYGDTNSTLAGAITASKMQIPIVHIEAGLRSYNKSMPEEINRILCDHVSTLLFSPTKSGYHNLLKEGFREIADPPYSSDNPGIYHCGDIMYDNSLYFSAVAAQKTNIIKNLGLQPGQFILVTIHRNNNTDEPSRLSALFGSILNLSLKNKIKILLPLHPRTSKLLDQNLEAGLLKRIKECSFIKIIPPVSYLEMTALEKNCKMVMTDSGGVQKEAFFFRKPCIILRSETEWVELVDCGSAIVVDADEKRIAEAYAHFSKKPDLQFPQLFGDGKAAQFICLQLIKSFQK